MTRFKGDCDVAVLNSRKSPYDDLQLMTRLKGDCDCHVGSVAARASRKLEMMTRLKGDWNHGWTVDRRPMTAAESDH